MNELFFGEEIDDEKMSDYVMIELEMVQ